MYVGIYCGKASTDAPLQYSNNVITSTGALNTSVVSRQTSSLRFSNLQLGFDEGGASVEPEHIDSANVFLSYILRVIKYQLNYTTANQSYRNFKTNLITVNNQRDLKTGLTTVPKTMTNATTGSESKYYAYSGDFDKFAEWQATRVYQDGQVRELPLSTQGIPHTEVLHHHICLRCITNVQGCSST